MKRYLISEASAMTGLEAHVLRYWEEELGLLIPRNELGHRYYTEEHLNILARAKEMKGKGYQLKAIKSELFGEIHSEDVDNLQPPVPVHTDVVPSEDDKTRDIRMEQFKQIIGSIVTQSLRDNNEILGDRVIKEMDYLMRMREEAEEDRYKRLDETIRNCQRIGRDRKKHKKRTSHI